ncbi:MAG: type II toxin-antitoxin system VapC family toxin [Methylococcales bacterium]
MGYLIDTNVISENRKNEKANLGVKNWFAAINDEQVYLSVLTLGEIRQGIEQLKRRDITAANRLQQWLEQIEVTYAPRILPITQPISDCWGRINVPDKLPVIDGYLAATALVHNLTLVTRNIKDVERSGVKLLNPFDEETK